MNNRLFFLIGLILSQGLNANQFHNYFWANYQQFQGNKQETRKWYDHIFSDANASVLNNKGYLHFLEDVGDFHKIVALMPKLDKVFAQDPDVQLVFVNALKKVGKKNEADARIIDVSRNFKHHTEIVFNAAETLVQRKEHQNALALLDEYLNNAPRRPNNFIFYFLKGQIHMQLGQLTQAHAFLQQCLESHPRFPQGWLLKAMIEEQTGELDQAINGFRSYLELNGPNKQIERHVLELVIKQKASQRGTNTVVLNRPCLERAVALFEKKQYRSALQHINACLTQNESNPQMRLLKIQILTALQEFTEAVKLLVSWSASEPNNVMWPQVLHLLSRAQAPVEKIITAFTALQSRSPQNITYNLYLADLHTRAGNSSQALGYHAKALSLATDTRIKTRILFQIALLEYEQAHYAKMIQALDKLEALQPNFAPAYNLHAYYLATEGRDLEKAHTYFEKAYALDKGNPHILDTHGVILYKQKKYTEALALLKPLSEKMPEDGSILIHLAKTYAKLGDYANARTAIATARKHARTPYEEKTSRQLFAQWNARA